MSVYELLINQVRATNGNMFISSVAKCVSANASSITFEDPTERGLVPFAIGDLILAQTVNLEEGLLIYVKATVTEIAGLVVSVT